MLRQGVLGQSREVPQAGLSPARSSLTVDSAQAHSLTQRCLHEKPNLKPTVSLIPSFLRFLFHLTQKAISPIRVGYGCPYFVLMVGKGSQKNDCGLSLYCQLYLHLSFCAWLPLLQRIERTVWSWLA